MKILSIILTYLLIIGEYLSLILKKKHILLEKCIENNFEIKRSVWKKEDEVNESRSILDVVEADSNNEGKWLLPSLKNIREITTGYPDF